MQFIFEPDLSHQTAAIEAACDLFKGAEPSQGVFTVAPGAIPGQLALAERTLGYGNQCQLLDDEVLANLQAVQERGGLEVETALKSMNFTIEMETGTGKTYVYLRTIFELNRRYGFTKFVIVVPSVAIREGVKKSIEQTRAHFHALYDGAVFDSFVYDSGDLSKVRDFASSSSIKVMIVTIQSINSANNVFYDGREQTQDIPAVDWVRQTRPILIVDEPQSVDGGLNGAGKRALDSMGALATLRYSATHRDRFHQIYRLDAFDAHERGLVKSIEVDAAKIEDAVNNPYVRLVKVEAKKGKAPRAQVELAVQQLGGVVRREVWVYDGDDLVTASNGRTIYAGLTIGEIDARKGGSIQLEVPGEVLTLRCGESHGDVDAMGLARQMIRQTIERHFRKELRNRPMGIKTLSLFFINRVADYRTYAEDGSSEPGPLAVIFDEEYRKLAQRADFRSLFVDAPADPARAHDGYFSMDKRRRFTEPTLNAAGEFSNATSRDDATRAFDLIMKDKEKLLDEAEPLRFIFSHSALREGWDNPNVFQICVLRGMATEMQRRQSIGRGLRLCVDNDGNRRRDEGLNVLTVVSDEPFRKFADGLQKEIEDDLGIKLGMVDSGLFANLTYTRPDGTTATLTFRESKAIFDGLTAAGMVDGHGKVTDALRHALAEGTVPLPEGLSESAATKVRQTLTRLARKLSIRDANAKGQVKLNLDILDSHDFQELWRRISTRTTYRVKFDDQTLIDNAARRIADMPAPGVAQVTFERAKVVVERAGVSPELLDTSVPRRLETERLQVPDLLGELQNRTDLPRKVIAHILINSGRVNEAATNPAAFLDAVTQHIRDAKREVLVQGIQYHKLDEQWFAQELFTPEDSVDEERMIAVRKSPLSHVVHDNSNIEKELATAFDTSAAIKVFAKLPRAFKVNTPIGTYNPDWAVVREDENELKVYLVAESKGSLNNLRDDENAKIACGKAHFAELKVPFDKAITIRDVLAIGTKAG
jgi:type III restriction enzyme